tara:strand:+ start:50864 stop:51562 length:699 start_codon:yes stop_codon:yes gene_type:complete
MNPVQLIKLSEQLLLEVKLQKDSSALQLKLKELELALLENSLINDERKKAFWINIYNAYYQILRIDRKVALTDIYKKKLISIAGKSLSLDDVEHGVLRRYRHKYSLGLFSNPLSPKFIKKNAVDILDYRIHFALNCGAKSCPPIAFYSPTNINAQLDRATQSFLDEQSQFKDNRKVVSTTSLFKWFYFDFGGEKGIKRIFAEQLNKDISDYKITYTQYSWDEELVNFTAENP